jgi:hypothetical protein
VKLFKILMNITIWDKGQVHLRLRLLLLMPPPPLPLAAVLSYLNALPALGLAINTTPCRQLLHHPDRDASLASPVASLSFLPSCYAFALHLHLAGLLALIYRYISAIIYLTFLPRMDLLHFDPHYKVVVCRLC